MVASQKKKLFKPTVQRLKTFLKTISRHGPLRIVKRILLQMRENRSLRFSLQWAMLRTEDSNFYYQITVESKIELAQIISEITKCPTSEVLQYFHEIESSDEVTGSIAKFLEETPSMSDSTLHFGRRLAIYALVRIYKPSHVLETGVHNGLGALAFLAALKRNYLEGYSGCYTGIDINPIAGKLASNYLDERYGQILFGDSIEIVTELRRGYDFVFTDSNHSPGYEISELETISRDCSPNTVYISDNPQSGVLKSFATQRELAYLEFWEKPLNHWYKGSGIGMAFRRTST